MTIAVLLVLIIGFAFLERKWADYALRSVQLHSECEHRLAAPDETVNYSVTLENHSPLAIPFVRLVLEFPDEAACMADDAWKKTYCRKNILSWNVEYRMTLRRRRSMIRQVPLSFSRRGVYMIGSYHLGAGDLLGFREAKCHGKGTHVVVMPRLSAQKTATDALGGFLGDVSVRRFILEDPILTTGFRDYTGREPMRAISWTRTAQSGALQVKQYDYTAEHHVVVLLNTAGADEEQFEECLRLTRSVCEKLEQRKIPYAFRTNANLPGPVCKIHSMMEGLGEQHLNTILYGLGAADGTCFHSFQYLTRQTLKKRKGSESYIVITPEPDGVSRGCIQDLGNVAGAQICVLYGCMGVEEI